MLTSSTAWSRSLSQSCCAGWFCATKADIAELAKRHPGEGIVAGVVGCGPVGLMAILAARAQGATKVNSAAILSAPTALVKHTVGSKRAGAGPQCAVVECL